MNLSQIVLEMFKRQWRGVNLTGRWCGNLWWNNLCVFFIAMCVCAKWEIRHNLIMKIWQKLLTQKTWFHSTQKKLGKEIRWPIKLQWVESEKYVQHQQSLSWPNKLLHRILFWILIYERIFTDEHFTFGNKTMFSISP